MVDILINTTDIPNEKGKNIKLVSFEGQLDESNVDERSNDVYEVLNNNPDRLHLILNLEKLEYMNSKAIGYLTDWYTKVHQTNGKLVILKPKENILDLLQVVGLTQLIGVYDSLEEAKLAML